MPENDQGQEKTEQGTDKRREEARAKGQVAKSRELASVAVLFTCLIYFNYNIGGLLQKIMAMMSLVFRSAGQTTLSTDSAPSYLNGLIVKAFFMLLPLFGFVFVVALMVNILQVGFFFSSSSIQPQFARVNPMKGFKNIFSLRSLVELIKSIIKMVVIGFIAYLVISEESRHCLPLAEQSIWGIMLYMGKVSFKILLNTCWVLIILAIIDYLYQRWEHAKSLRMSRQEIKEEFKNSEGDPIIKARIKRLQREMAKKRMMAAVPTADVIITNPTHLAVALKYEQEKRSAPYVVAKGAGQIAEKIRDAARENRVPIIENKPLAQVLYKMVKINESIPANLYRSVAEILAYVYSLRRK